MIYRRLFTVLPVFAVLCGCRSEAPLEDITSKQTFTVKAALPDPEGSRSYITFGNPENSSRAQITYGNPDPLREIFMWDEDDEIFVFNVSKISECKYGIKMVPSKINGNIAEFKIASDTDASSFRIDAGDLIFVNYYVTERGNTSDDREVFTMYVGTESNKPQYIVEDPDNSSLEYMQHNLRMYDIMTATEDNKIPDIHFRHLSAILRITLRNETGNEIYPTKLEYKYPGTESFFNTTLYCSIDTTLSSGLRVYTDYEFFKGSEPYTDNIGTTINGKDGTEDSGSSIAAGKTYDLYISTVPRIENKQKGDTLSIHLIENHNTGNPYIITLDKFNVPIVAGKRYWFNLTATEEYGKRELMLTSDWLDKHSEKKQSEGE